MSFLQSIRVLPACLHVFRPAIFRPISISSSNVFVVLVLAVGLLLSAASNSYAQDKAWPKGEEIARRINDRDDGQAVSQTLLMELIDRRGKKRVRQTRAFRKYVNAERRTVIFYLSPENIKGTAFLTYDYPETNREDTQWLYLPAMRKVRRIAAANRGDYFLGTDFTYDDIKLGSKVNLTDYSRTTTGEDKVDDHHCYVVDAIPVNKKIAEELGYSRVQQWVDSKIWMTRKAEFWDNKGNPLKQIHFQDIQKVQGIWTAHRIEVQNHKTGHRTVFVFSDIDYKKGVDDELFTNQALSRGL